MVAVSAESVAAARAAATAAGLDYPILSDATLATINRFGLFHHDEPDGRRIARPALFILDRQGVVRYAHVGEHRQDRPALGAILLALETIT